MSPVISPADAGGKPLVLAERRAIAQSIAAFVCSPTDAYHLRRIGFPRNVRSVPNAIDIPLVPPGVVATLTVLYLGTYYYPPNVLAAERLIRRIWPLIRDQVPSARLLIADAHDEHLPSYSAGVPGVEFLGFVDDIPNLYAQTRLVCAPITVGSGTRLKLLEAAAYARPMVSTRVGAEGLEFGDGREIILREDNVSLAKACIDLLRNETLCDALGTAAYTMARFRYDARHIEQLIVDKIVTRA